MLFQYNSCYCLSTNNKQNFNVAIHFNTTLVIVYHNNHFKWQLLGHISIQLLLLFIVRGKLESILGGFQYNSCYCLSLGPAVSDALNTNFNTTLVIVYHRSRVSRKISRYHFNTTLVIVYRYIKSCRDAGIDDFNTTLVIVYR